MTDGSRPPFDEARDATRRTRLANERTYLAWWRSGLTALAVAVGTGKIVPAMGGGTPWHFQLIGAGFGVLGVVFILYAYLRHRHVERALDRGEYAPLDRRVALGLALGTAILGAATVALLLVGDT